MSLLVKELMPITYSIDRNLSVIFEVWQGEITARELGEYWHDYLDDPEVMSIRRTLVDLRSSTLLFDGQEMWNLVTSLVIPRLNGRTWKTAIVVRSPDQFGVSRQYQVFAKYYSHDSIFHDDELALNWLVQPDLVADATGNTPFLPRVPKNSAGS